MAVIPGNTILQSDMAALAALANSKGTLPNYLIPGNASSGTAAYSFSDYTTWAANTYFSVGQIIRVAVGNFQVVNVAGTTGATPPTWSATIGNTTTDNGVTWQCVKVAWLSELNRLRGNLNSAITQMQFDAGKLSVSGPWPISGPAWSNHQQWFWYEDTGGAVTVTVSCGFSGSSSGRFGTTIVYNHVVNSSGSWPSYTPIDELDLRTFTIPDPANPGTLTYRDCLYATFKEYSIIIGGSLPAPLTGTFYVAIPISSGKTVVQNYAGSTTTTADPTDPTTLVSLDASTNFPGTFSKRVCNGADSLLLFLQWDVNQTVNPGRYDIRLIFNTNGNDSTIVTDGGLTTTVIQPTRLSLFNYESGKGVLLGVASITWGTPSSGVYPYPTIGGGVASINFVFNTPVAADGIDNAKNLFKIALFDLDTPEGIFSSGIYSVNELAIDPLGTSPINVSSGQVIFQESYNTTSYYPSTAWEWSPFPQPWFNVERVAPGAWSVTTSTPGFWTGVTTSVSNLNCASFSQMPWNLVRTHNTSNTNGSPTFTENPMLSGNSQLPTPYPASGPRNSYDNTLPVESQLEPPIWKASTPFTVGFCIIDANGNLQKLTAVTIGGVRGWLDGVSGSATPGWSRTLSGTTADTNGTTVLTWTCYKVLIAADTWVGLTAITAGKTIIDKNGNTQTACAGWQANTAISLGQTIIDSNGNKQQVTTAGTTGLSAPAWNTSLSGTTTDGGVTWTNEALAATPTSGAAEPTWKTALNAITLDGMAAWKLTLPAQPIVPAVHRPVGVPRYPVYWQSETIAALKPPLTNAETEKTIWGCGNQWQRNNYRSQSYPYNTVYDTGWQQDNLAKGWWIYSVSLTRTQFEVYDPATTGIGQNGFGAGGGAPGIGGSANEVQVTIGCIRAGVFVAFGTFLTGQTYQVLWPVFTSDPLVYQCSERIDLQAVAIASGGAGVSVGTSVNYPMCAAFVSDVTALLNLIT